MDSNPGSDAARLSRIDDLVRALSRQDDADAAVRLFARDGDFLVRRDGFVTVSRRGVAPPAYRVTRSWLWTEPINPWTEAHRLPVVEGGLLGDLFDAGRPVALPHLNIAVDDPLRAHLAGMRSLAFAPSYDHGQPLNAVVLLRHAADAFTPTDLENLLLHANLLGRAVANLQLAHDLEEAYRRLDEEMQQAARVQRALLGPRLPEVPGLELGVRYETCSRAGGDYYRITPIEDGKWSIFLADISGHGVAAAVGTAILHALLHACPPPLAAPGRVLDRLNTQLTAVAPRGLFATAVYAVYDAAARRLRYAVAGHPPPLRRRGHQVEEWEPTGGLPLNVLPEATWDEKEVAVAPGDALLFYTDGVVEGTNLAGEPFGKERLADALRLGPPRAARLASHVERLYRDFRGAAPDLDDRTLLAAVAVP